MLWVANCFPGLLERLLLFFLPGTARTINFGLPGSIQIPRETHFRYKFIVILLSLATFCKKTHGSCVMPVATDTLRFEISLLTSLYDIRLIKKYLSKSKF